MLWTAGQIVRKFSTTSSYLQNKLKLAIIGQSVFGQEVYTNLRKQGHKVVGVFTVPDKDGKADPLECPVEPNDTVDTLYNRFLFPEGIKAMVESVQLIADGKAPRIVQPEEGASYEGIQKKSNAKVNMSQPAESIHNWIRGHDKVPGAWTIIDGQPVTLYGSSMLGGSVPAGEPLQIEGASQPGIVSKSGLVLFGSDGNALLVKNLQFEDGKMIPASKYFSTGESSSVELTDDEQKMADQIKLIWKGILSNVAAIEDTTDFFKSGAASMDVVRLVEEVKQCCPSVLLQNEDVYMASTFQDFIQMFVRKLRGEDQEEELVVDYVTKEANNMTVKMPYQCFINGKFEDAENGKTYNTINPTDGSVISKVSYCSVGDVDRAVAAAKEAYEEGPWGRMNPRDRGSLLYRLADLMEQHQEELATIEALDSGAVYTLALKTHVGMSIQTFRYFAGWCDKIQGKTIPINQARPNRNLTFTKKEPLGVCAIVIPWNYPLMMLAWKSAACLAAGNTLVLKPAQVTPLTALKFAELSVKAGIPKGVINILPGSGGRDKKMKIGDPLDRSTDHGPQNHKAHLDKLLEYCEVGVKEGATLVYGGRQVDRPGFFMEPTVFTDVEDHMFIAKEESFGPVMVVSKFKDGDVDGVLRRANDTEYGLASGVFTRDINKAMYVSERLEAGTVFVNTYNKTDVASPFGGFKQSGFGKDLGEDALSEYLKTKAITVEY
ncbi:hypothetical protein WMY93_030847 [Mugilogobius chulae]|uniref:Carrier domain-containing protein n=1 Tax=Mugilogobius chulae TaxID=88201 RepID=A0AAW0MQZ5_9GOBI